MKTTILLALTVLGANAFAQTTVPAANSAAAQAKPAAKELIFDGGFDNIKRMNTTSRHFGYYKNNVYYGWTISPNEKYAIENTILDDKVFVSKPNSIKLIAMEKKPLFFSQSLNYYGIKLAAGKQYKVSYMIKIQNVKKPGICLNLWAGKNIWFKALEGTSDWQKMEHVFTAPAEAANSSRFEVIFRFCGTGTAWIDNVSLIEL